MSTQREKPESPSKSAVQGTRDRLDAEHWRSLRPEVQAMAKLMEEQLRSNDYKGGWSEDPWATLLLRAYEEMGELHRELTTGAFGTAAEQQERRKRVGKEGADVCNFVLMILDVWGVLKRPEKG